ncbi:alpha/beta fold hydrolase [Zavarzinia sp. CC-PAN008]|uniref:alpha/beta fold hydrolase n=1 Tax=Zavarzinia sp. CC-PAN008 TaxID=3243332 RepID=UPI003F747807
MSQPTLKSIRTSVLDLHYEESGPPDGRPVVLVHGFPDDPRTWDGAVERLVPQGYRVIVPYLRGYGPTRFLDPGTMRSGQQAALGQDLRDLILGLDLKGVLLGGYDWGGRACCINAALWPDRVRGLLSITGYNIHDIAAMVRPGSAEEEVRNWYQWYFHTSRGEAGLTQNRHDLCRLIWRLWSPNWAFDAATYARTGTSFDNPDFVAVVVHSYRVRYASTAGDPVYDAVETALAGQPPIAVPTIVLHGAADGVDPPVQADSGRHKFVAFYERSITPVAGHFYPREAPGEVATAIRRLDAIVP